MDAALKRLSIEKLRPKQRKILKYLLRGEDVFGLLPTGYGKSACYIIPHLLTGKNVIVISPLIALMQDQFTSLERCGVPAVCFNSHNPTLALSSDKNGPCGGHLLAQLRSGERTGVLYFSPEKFLAHERLIHDLAAADRLALVAVDEAHCVVTWSDFRNSYQRLGCIRDWTTPPTSSHKPPPLLALTASAPPSLLESLVVGLRLRSPRLVQASFWKPHLSLQFREKEGFEKDVAAIAEEIETTETKTVIYVKTRDATIKLAKALQSRVSAEYPVSYYHGGMEGGARLQTQTAFSHQPQGVMVATIAFGMGIDIPDIHLIIHYGVSRDIESYYQEIGRAGRDGGAAECIAFYNRADFALNRRFASDIRDVEHRQRQLDACMNLERLIRGRGCRMLALMAYFGETPENGGKGKRCERCERCERCDNCERHSESSEHQESSAHQGGVLSDASDPPLTSDVWLTYQTLSFLQGLGYGCGITKLAGVLTGGRAKSITFHMRNRPEYGCVRNTTQKDLRPRLETIQDAGHLQCSSMGSSGMTFLVVSPQGRKWITEMGPRIQAAFDTLRRHKIVAKYKNVRQTRLTLTVLGSQSSPSPSSSPSPPSSSSPPKPQDKAPNISNIFPSPTTPEETERINHLKQQVTQMLPKINNPFRQAIQTHFKDIERASSTSESLAFIEGALLVMKSYIHTTTKPNTPPPNELEKKLRQWRQDRAKQLKTPAYCIFPNKTLSQLVEWRPQTKTDLERIHQMGPSRIEKYGQDILHIIQSS